ncbi:MAG: S9 family peptidase [Acidobacteria bacterium]|nr:S9 family peptidase [Acidobacteriota bacterium]
MKNRRLSRTELVSYLDVDGTRSYGVLYYPIDYEPGKKYPTVFNIYEQFFDDTFQGTINVLTANGYAVVQPSVNLEQGFPGEAWVKGVTAAANKLIEMGVADPERLGVQGTSYGGYATNLLITQTNRFKAAINISGKVNMVSFYTDSPRLGVRNIHAPEKSQDRIGATLWQQPQKYIAHSAIMFADRIKTPLLLMTGDQDHNVPARQAMEMYYALRRLGKEVAWVSYTNGGHGMPTTTVEEVRDYHKRILAWYDDHLKGDLKKKAEEAKTQGQER